VGEKRRREGARKGGWEGDREGRRMFDC